jgi:thiol:disulfide interchange protein DsbA
MIGKALLRAAFGVLVAAQAWAVEEGIDYTELSKAQPTETGDKIEVLEVFMYSCPHCYHLEPTIEKWLASKPENVEFRRMPAVFGPKVVPHARAFYAAQMMGVEDKIHLPLFRALHDQKKRIFDEDSLVEFVQGLGVDGAEFRKAMNSFYVNMRVRRAQEMGKRFGVDGVPAVIVNGKYRTSPSQTGSRDKMIQVIDHLIGIESGGSPAAAVNTTPDQTGKAAPAAGGQTADSGGS